MSTLIDRLGVTALHCTIEQHCETELSVNSLPTVNGVSHNTWCRSCTAGDCIIRRPHFTTSCHEFAEDSVLMRSLPNVDKRTENEISTFGNAPIIARIPRRGVISNCRSKQPQQMNRWLATRRLSAFDVAIVPIITNLCCVVWWRRSCISPRFRDWGPTTEDLTTEDLTNKVEGDSELCAFDLKFVSVGDCNNPRAKIGSLSLTHA